MSNRPQRTAKQQTSPPKKKGRLNNMELVGIGLFTLCFMMYSLSKCFQTKTKSTSVSTSAVADSTDNSLQQSTLLGQQLLPRKVDTSAFKNKLYVIVDSLRLRSEPNIGGSLIGYLRLGDALKDLGERTLHEKIRISTNESKVAPWIKVATLKGLEGWAFGGCLQFYPPPEQATQHLNSQESSHQH
jgi:hypothetical protein